MTQQQHLTTMKEQRATFPSEELVKGWCAEWYGDASLVPFTVHLARKAADWQLEQVCDWLNLNYNYPEATLSALRNAMRPKPKSLAELAIEEWDYLKSDLARQGMGISKGNLEKALERLKELEAQQSPALSPINP